jgi:hypothetical protein
MMVKSGLEKFILQSLHAGTWLFLLTEFVILGKNLDLIPSPSPSVKTQIIGGKVYLS